MVVPTPYDVDCPTVRSRLIPLCASLVKKGYAFTFLVQGRGTEEVASGITCRGYGNYLELLRIIGCLGPGETDIVFACKPYSITGMASFIIAKLRGLAYVLDVDDRTFPSEIIKWWRLPLYIQEWCVERFLMLARPLTVVASSTLAVYWGNHVAYIPNSADLKRFSKSRWNSGIIRDRFRIQSPVVIWPAVFFQETDRDYVLKIFSCIQAKGSNISLLVIGDGEYLPFIREKAKRMGMANVVFAGRIHYEEMPHYYASADAGILPLRNSHYDACKGPIKLYEYMAMELPVIATDTGEPKAVLENAGCGIIVPFEEPDRAANMIIELFSTPELLRNMGDIGRRFLLERQSFEHLAEKLETIFIKALDATVVRRGN